MTVQDDVRAAAKAALQSKGLGAGGARKRLRLVEQETKRLHQVSTFLSKSLHLTMLKSRHEWSEMHASLEMSAHRSGNRMCQVSVCCHEEKSWRIPDTHVCILKVMAHPQFRADPIAAITSHLSATVPPPPEAPKPKPDPAMRKQLKALRKWKQKLQGPDPMAEDSD